MAVFERMLLRRRTPLLTPDGLKPFWNGRVPGEGVKGYDLYKALSISTAELKRLGLRHLDSGGITQTQRALFTELAQSGRPNTLAEHARIARESLLAGGMSQADAVDVVQRAMAQLKSWVSRPPQEFPGTEHEQQVARMREAVDYGNS